MRSEGLGVRGDEMRSEGLGVREYKKEDFTEHIL